MMVFCLRDSAKLISLLIFLSFSMNHKCWYNNIIKSATFHKIDMPYIFTFMMSVNQNKLLFISKISSLYFFEKLFVNFFQTQNFFFFLRNTFS